MPSPNKKDNPTSIFGQTVTAPTNPGEWIGKSWRTRISTILTCLLKPTITQRVDDGTGLITSLDAEIKMGPTGYSVLLPIVAKAGGSSVPFSNFGLPDSGTLSSGVSYVTTPTPSLYLDMTNKVLYVCTTAGTNITSVWSLVGSGIRQFKIKTLSGASTYAAEAWNGTAASGAYTVYKSNKNIPIASETIDGVSFTYSYGTGYGASQDNSRTASDGTNTEKQTLYPRFVVGDVVYAVQPDNMSGLWVEISPARLWIRSNSQ